MSDMTEWGSKTDKITVRLTPDLKRRLRLTAGHVGVSPSDAACQLMELGWSAFLTAQSPAERDALVSLAQVTEPPQQPPQ